jgi:hypothetical protein
VLPEHGDGTFKSLVAVERPGPSRPHAPIL